MKYMLIMRATDAALAASAEVDFEEVVNQMGAYNEAMHDAGVLAGGEGLTDEEIAEIVSEGTEYIAKEKVWRREETERAQREG